MRHCRLKLEKEKNSFSIDVSVPEGNSAAVDVPAGEGQPVVESGKLITGSEYITPGGYVEGFQVFKVRSGDYSFKIKQETLFKSFFAAEV